MRVRNPIISIPGYALIKVIGAGAYGQVWLAQTKDGSYCALKVVRNAADRKRRFEREWRAVDFLSTLEKPLPGIIRVLEAVRFEDKVFYYAMPLADDFIRGQKILLEHYVPWTLRGYLNVHRVLAVEDVLALGLFLTRALAGLHACNLVHRDVKPANVVMIEGRPVLADIGLVAFASEANSIVGTPHYVPPENHGSFAGDVYSLGQLLYECLTGNPPGAYGEVPQLESDTTDKRFAQLLRIVQKACEGNPGRRYQTMPALGAELNTLFYRKRKLRNPILALLVTGSLIAGAWNLHQKKIKTPPAAIEPQRVAINQPKEPAPLPILPPAQPAPPSQKIIQPPLPVKPPPPAKPSAPVIIAKEEKPTIEEKRPPTPWELNARGVALMQAGNPEKDTFEAFRLFQEAAQSNLPEAYCNMGICYEKGYGTSKTLSKAVKYYSIAAEQGVAIAQYNLGCCLLTGRGISKNETLALIWIERAAMQGHTMAAQYLAKNRQQLSSEAITSIPKPFRNPYSHSPSAKQQERLQGYSSAILSPEGGNSIREFYSTDKRFINSKRLMPIE